MKKIVLLGSGNVATHLAKALHVSGMHILQVWSRTIDNAQTLADAVEANAISDINDVSSEADYYIVSVKDDAIVPLLSTFPHEGKVIMHTAGSVDINVLAPYAGECAVFYPLQTFSKAKDVNFKEIPLLLEATDSSLLQELQMMAESISDNVKEASSAQRKWLHISAVFACNFVNHMFAIGEEILEDKGLSFDLIRPLIKETCDKSQLLSPKSVQTGPAIRHDHDVMDAHLKMLKDVPDLQQLYHEISARIGK